MSSTPAAPPDPTSVQVQSSVQSANVTVMKQRIELKAKLNALLATSVSQKSAKARKQNSILSEIVFIFKVDVVGWASRQDIGPSAAKLR